MLNVENRRLQHSAFSIRHSGVLFQIIMQRSEKRVPHIVVSRLPVYLRALMLMEQQGKSYTSSHELAGWLGCTPAQIRKDLSHFGEFGKQGTGYSVSGLQKHLRNILHLEREWPVIVVGAGHIGSAIANYSGFSQRGFKVYAVFDNAKEKIGSAAGKFIVQDATDLGAFVAHNGIRHAMLAVPASAAQSVADALVKSGVSAILNYAPVHLTCPPHVQVEYIDPAMHLQMMTHYVG